MLKLFDKQKHKIDKLIQNHLIHVNKHPNLPLYIYNYTKKCQIDWAWTPETIIFRGLVVDDNDNIISKPFAKFFTLEQYKQFGNKKLKELYELNFDELFTGKYIVTEKLDGSLGILYQYNDYKGITTRGRFDSEQAIHATKILNEKYSQYNFNKEYTYLFEIIYPENKHVVKYNIDDIIVIAVLDKAGRCVDEEMQRLAEFGFKRAKVIDIPQSFSVYELHGKLQQLFGGKDCEGAVIFYPETNIRVKFKTEKYLEKQRLLSNLSAYKVWEILSGEKKYSISEFLDLYDDEEVFWIIKTANRIIREYCDVFEKARDMYMRVKDMSRKEFAIKYEDCPYKSIVFAMMDSKDYTKMLWRAVKPSKRELFKD